MNADDVKQVFDSQNYEYAFFKFTDGTQLTAEELTVFNPKSLLVNKTFLVNLDNVKYVKYAKDELEASN